MEKARKQEYKHTLLAGLVAGLVVAFFVLGFFSIIGWFYLQPYY